MFKIVRFPSRLEPFFRNLRERFHWDHFDYFRTLVLLVAFAWGRRNVSALYRCLDSRQYSHRSRFNNFVLVQRWDQAATLRMKAQELIAALDPKPGDQLRLLIDDSKKGKRGGKRKGGSKRRKNRRGNKAKRGRNRRPKGDKYMQAVGWIHDPVSNRKTRGHQYVTAVIEFRGFVIPLGISLYVKKEFCRDLGVKFKKVTQLAAEMIRAFDPPEGVEVLVEFDSYYLCPRVVKACRQKGYHFVSILKSNRNLFKNGRKLKAGEYGKNLFRRKSKKRKATVHKGDRITRYEYIDIDWLNVSKLGNAHVVFSRRTRDRNIVALVTDHPKFSAEDMIRSYAKRWSVEVFFRDGKQLLGLGQYQNGTYGAAVTHLHLVCFAYALLTHIAIKGERAKGKKKKRKVAARLSTAQLQNELRRIVWDDLSKYLRELPTGDAVMRELKRLLIAA